MRLDRLERTLRELHACPTRDGATGRRDLRAELLARHARTASRRQGGRLRAAFMRPVLAMLLLAVLGVGACTVPTETDVEMGRRLTWTVADATAPNRIGDLVRLVEAQPGVDEVSIREDVAEGGPLVVDLVIWGRGIAVEALCDRVHEAFPELADADLESEPLTTRAETSLAGKLGHEVLHLDLDLHVSGTDAEIRAQILEQIYAGGFDGLADVDVRTEDGVVTVDLEMTEELGADQVREDVIRIDLQRDD